MISELCLFHSISITFLLGLLYTSLFTKKITFNIQDYEFIYTHEFGIIQWIILIGIYLYDPRYYFFGFCITLYLYMCYIFQS